MFPIVMIEEEIIEMGLESTNSLIMTNPFIVEPVYTVVHGIRTFS